MEKLSTERLKDVSENFYMFIADVMAKLYISKEKPENIKIRLDDAMLKATNFVSERVDFSQLNKEELEIMGLREWENNLMLIPLVLYPAIPKGTELTHIDGGKFVKGKDYIDLDVRLGKIAFGIYPKNNEVESGS